MLELLYILFAIVALIVFITALYFGSIKHNYEYGYVLLVLVIILDVIRELIKRVM